MGFENRANNKGDKTEPAPKEWFIENTNEDETIIKLRKDIEKAKNIGDLIHAVRQSRGIHGSKQFFSGEKLAGLIEDVKEGKRDTDSITRSEGLRDKLEDLLKGTTIKFPLSKVGDIKQKSEKEKMLSLGLNEKGENIDRSELSKKIEQVKSFEDLTDILLETKDVIPSTLGKLSGIDILKIIDKVKKGEISYKGVPRARGIQKTFERLLVNDQRSLIKKLDKATSLGVLYGLLNDSNGYLLNDFLYKEEKIKELTDNIKKDDEATLFRFGDNFLINKIKELLKKEDKNKE